MRPPRWMKLTNPRVEGGDVVYDMTVQEPTCTLYVNDHPVRRVDGGVDGGYEYLAGPAVVAVSFVAANGRAVRVSFDRDTGDLRVSELEPAKRAES